MASSAISSYMADYLSSGFHSPASILCPWIGTPDWLQLTFIQINCVCCWRLTRMYFIIYSFETWRLCLNTVGRAMGSLFPQCEDVFSLAPLVSDHVFARLFDTTARLDTQKLQQSAPSPHCRGPRYDFSEKYVFSAHLLLTDNTSKNNGYSSCQFW